MEQLYLEFDKEEFEKNLELFKRLQDEKNGDLKEAFTLFTDRYINGEMDLPVFLQVVNNIGYNRDLLKGIEKVKKYVEKIDCKVGIINIYEILIYYNNNSYELSKELLSIDKENKIAKIFLARCGEKIEYKKPTQNFSTYDLAILYNKLLYCKDDYMYYDNYDNIDEFANYLQDIININEKVIEKDIENSEESYFWKDYYAPDFKSIQSDLGKIYHIKYIEDKDIKNYEKAEKFYKKSIIDYINVDILFCHSLYNGSNLFTDENGNKVDYIFMDYNGNKRILKDNRIWDVEGNSLGDIDEFDYIMFDWGNEVDNYVVNEDGSKSYISQRVEDSIICLAHLYYEEKEYRKVLKLMDWFGESLIKKFYYYRIMGWNTYKINECKETAKASLEYLIKSITEFNTADYNLNLFELFGDPDPVTRELNNSLFNHMKDALATIKLMYKMQKRGHIDYNAAKESLSELYFYNSEDYYFNLYALSVAFEIEDYEHCSKIADKIIKNIKNYNIDYKKVLEYLIISLHKLNKDNSDKLLKIFNEKDFNNYEYIIKLINECSKSEVLNKSVKIKDKKVLIDIYEIMSVSRKELIVMRLFDYIRNADGYANIKIDKETKEKKISKIARWKGETVKINYKENEDILCYHFHTSSEVQFKDGKSIKFSKDGSNNRIKNIRRLPAENWIAINQIRDTLAHRINENDTDVNEAVRTTKRAREFIEANFTSIIECLFNVIKENNLLTDDKFNSEDF
ncbi:hypothetical protein [Brachyspira aalborgi]|uniref:Uncharacterized protein n=1 Tax=Brachyspira aalborgi TaxID=29522 RepID=A0A5C8CMR3_9SPIR|nr:hypothetical protein [Brachyspira aalborgi]TXJ13491.1 hypothetical protein EPJ80_01745 [Brachyspira aalborgi]